MPKGGVGDLAARQATSNYFEGSGLALKCEDSSMYITGARKLPPSPAYTGSSFDHGSMALKAQPPQLGQRPSTGLPMHSTPGSAKKLTASHFDAGMQIRDEGAVKHMPSRMRPHSAQKIGPRDSHFDGGSFVFSSRDRNANDVARDEKQRDAAVAEWTVQRRTHLETKAAGHGTPTQKKPLETRPLERIQTRPASPTRSPLPRSPDPRSRPRTPAF